MDLVFYVLAGSVAAIVVFRWLWRRTTVLEFEAGLLYRKGVFQRVLGPGAYWMWRHRSSIDTVDRRRRFVTVPGQEVLSKDSITLKVSLAAEFEVADAAVAVHHVQSFADALYLELQLALRDLVGGLTADELLEQRSEMSSRLLQATEARAAALGLTLHAVGIKDIMFPGELKKVFAQVVKARKEGLAALERARGETAALRHLANAARMMENNPSLMQLRTLQTLGEGSGNTVVFGAPAAVAPIPMGGESPPRPSGDDGSDQ